MAITPNFSWVTPAPTDFVTDLPADFETFADAVDATVKTVKDTADAAIPETLIDAAGDLIYGSAADTAARLAIGTAGQVLKVNSGATAPEWGSASADANWTLVNTGGTALTGAGTITVSGISGANKLMVVIQSASLDAASQFITMRFNADTGSNYDARGLFGEGTNTYSARVFSSFGAVGTSIPLCIVSNNAASSAEGYLLLDGGNSAGLKVFNYSVGVFAASSSIDHRVYAGGGTYSGTSTISSVSLIAGSGNFDAGTVFVYKSA